MGERYSKVWNKNSGSYSNNKKKSRDGGATSTRTV